MGCATGCVVTTVVAEIGFLPADWPSIARSAAVQKQVCSWCAGSDWSTRGRSLASQKIFPQKNTDVLFLQKVKCIMIAIAQQATSKPQAAAVLGKAVARAAERLNISKALLAKVLGVSPPTVTRLCTGQYQLDHNRKEWDFALLFVRLFRSLDSIVGDESTARKWLNSDNLGLNAKPIDLIRSAEGLVRVVQYLDASRGLV
jgi:uncharacterized protein (DUF2384 family)